MGLDGFLEGIKVTVKKEDILVTRDDNTYSVVSLKVKRIIGLDFVMLQS